MFFSIIIPTYNPTEYFIQLLKSIQTNNCKDEIEIIISDDCSTKSFDYMLNQFNDLNIKRISNNKHSGFPRNGRQHGADVATGKWLTFIDQDDYLIDNALDKVKDYIIENNITYTLFSNFISLDENTQEENIQNATQGWTHGKFYEKIFWDKYKVCYDELNYCEDINLSTKVSCILEAINVEYTVMDECTYVWRRHKDTLSNEKYFIDSFPDYINATLGVILNYIEKYKEEDNEELHERYLVMFLETFFHMYFYLQSPLFFGKKKKVLEAILIIQPIFERFKEIYQCTTEIILYIVAEEILSVYSSTRNTDFKQIPFIEQLTFKQWLEVYFD